MYFSRNYLSLVAISLSDYPPNMMPAVKKLVKMPESVKKEVRDYLDFIPGVPLTKELMQSFNQVGSDVIKKDKVWKLYHQHVKITKQEITYYEHEFTLKVYVPGEVFERDMFEDLSEESRESCRYQVIIEISATDENLFEKMMEVRDALRRIERKEICKNTSYKKDDFHHVAFCAPNSHVCPNCLWKEFFGGSEI